MHNVTLVTLIVNEKIFHFREAHKSRGQRTDAQKELLDYSLSIR